TYAAQLIGLQPEVILASTTKNLEVIREATTTVPVVFVQVSDPVAQGFIASLTTPGGNLTGFSAYEFSTGGKWLDLLKEIAPGLARAAAAQMMRSDAGVHTDQTRRQVGELCFYLAAGPLLAQHDRATPMATARSLFGFYTVPRCARDNTELCALQRCS